MATSRNSAQMGLIPQITNYFAPASRDELTAVLTNFGFDPMTYRDSHPDLKEMNLSEDDAQTHYLLFGIQEFRDPAITPPFKDPQSIVRLPIANREVRFAFLLNLLPKWINHPTTMELNWQSDLAANAEVILDAGFEPYVIIGDSHTYAYAGTTVLDGRLLQPIHLPCTAGSALGLMNRASKSGYGWKILDLFSRLPATIGGKKLSIFFKFGAADAEFVSIFRRIKNGQTKADLAIFEAFAEESVRAYGAFLSQLLAIYPHPETLRICSVFPPVLSDAEWANGYVNAQVGYLESDSALEELSEAITHLEIPDLFTRTSMNAMYNGMLQIMCARLGLVFVNDFAPLLSSAGVIQSMFVEGHGGKDHHIDPQLINPILSRLVATFATVAPLGASPF